MTSADEKFSTGRSELLQELESPFLDRKPDVRQENEEWEARVGALEAETVFAGAFEEPWAQPSVADNERADHEGGFAFEEQGVVGKDNRVRVKNTTGVPWRWICKIFVEDTRGRLVGSGTGVLVSNKHVLTAAHVVYDAYKNFHQYTIIVVPALDDLNEPFERYSLASKPKMRKEYSPGVDDWDFALLTLSTAVGEKKFESLKDSRLCYWASPQCGANTVFARLDPRTLNGRAAYTAGYPGRKGGRQLWCAAGILHSANEKRRTMWTTADATKGQSGSPVWVADNKRHCLVGIAVGAGTASNIVLRVTRELIRQLRAWITEEGETAAMVETEEAYELPVPLVSDQETESLLLSTAEDHEPPAAEWSPELRGRQTEDFAGVDYEEGESQVLDEQPLEERFDPTTVPKDVANGQANASAAFQAAANLATNFGNQAAALKLAELASKAKATDDADKKLAAVQKAKSQELISKEDAADHANNILSEMHGSEGAEAGKSSLEGIAQQLLDNGQEGSVVENNSAGIRVVDIKSAEFQADSSTMAPVITLNSNVGQSTNGRVAIFSFGTYIETNRFKTFARTRGFLETDVMFNADPDGLVKPNGVELVRDKGVDPVFSFYPVNGAVWRSKLDPSESYRDAFKAWVDAALQDDIDCLYLTGHHWSTSDTFILSSGESTSTFSLIGKRGKSTVSVGRGNLIVEFDVASLRNRCKLLFGYGCDVATKTASAIYQSIFGRGAGDVPVICGWNSKISVPKRAQASLSPNARYFQFLEDFANTNGAPANGRLQWFYDNHPMELVRAWGYATKVWHKDSARARGKDGKLYKFNFVGDSIQAVEDT